LLLVLRLLFLFVAQFGLQIEAHEGLSSTTAPPRLELPRGTRSPPRRCLPKNCIDSA